MAVKVCLLVTDDGDDHQAFSEALAEYETAVVLIILDSQKALELLKAKTHRLDFIFLDLSMYGIKINTFLKVINSDSDFRDLKVTVYGDETDFYKIDNRDGLIFFNKEYDYSELKSFLTGLIRPAMENGS